MLSSEHQVSGPRFQKQSFWRQSKASFELFRSRSFEVLGSLLSAAEKRAETPAVPLKALSCYQDQPHFYIESLDFTAVETGGGFLLFRPTRCQLCKGQSTAHSVQLTKSLSWSQLYDCREKQAKLNSQRSSGSRGSASSTEECSGRRPALSRNESTEMTRTTKRIISANAASRSRKNNRKWNGPGSSFFKAFRIFFNPKPP